MSDRNDVDDKALAVRDRDLGAQVATRELTVDDMIARKEKIHDVVKRVMREGEHYGKIPGCGPKPALLKGGAEILAMTFGLSPSFDVRRTDLPGGHREYEVTCTLRTLAGVSLGEGLGSCSTLESKYRWRNGERKCPSCGKSTIIKGKEEYGGGWLCFAKKGGCGAKWPTGSPEIEGQQVGRVENPDLADTWNTVLKMAKKRAQVDATLTAVGASDLLTQDIEELGDIARDDVPRYREERRSDDCAVDADFVDRPRSSAAEQQQQMDPWESEADDLIELLQQSRTPDQVKSLGPRATKIPKGTRARARVADAYSRRLKAISGDA